MKRILLVLTTLLVVVVAPSLAQLNGAYTIDGAQAAGGTNFQTFKAACDTLTAAGVSGNVTFTISSGTYTDSALVINPTTNLPSASQTVTFVLASGASVTHTILVKAGQWAWTIGSSAPN